MVVALWRQRQEALRVSGHPGSYRELQASQGYIASLVLVNKAIQEFACGFDFESIEGNGYLVGYSAFVEEDGID